MFITITSLFREVKLITTLIINITQHIIFVIYFQGNVTFVTFILKKKEGCIPTPETLKLYDYKCFYLLNDDFGGKFQNPFSPKLFTEIFGALIKNPPNICSPNLFSPKLFAPNIFAFNVYIYNIYYIILIYK